MSENGLDRQLQEALERERQGQGCTSPPGNEPSLELAAYRTVFKTLDAPAEFQLPADFAARVMVAVKPEPFPWFERLVLPLCLTAVGAGVVVFYLQTCAGQWRALLQMLRGARLDLIGVVVLLGVVARLLNRRAGQQTGVTRVVGH